MSTEAITSAKPMHFHEKIGELAHQAYYQSAPVISRIIHGIPSIPHNIDQGIWRDRVVAKLDKLDAALEKKMPNFGFQNKLDHLGYCIRKKFAPLEKFNTWLNSNGNGAWDLKLATFLVKLPLRVARNIINLLYQIIKGILYFAVHPLKSINAIAKLIVKLLHELTKPETWTLMGIGMIGAGLGQTLVTGNPFALIGVAIGGAMAISGLGLGALKAAIKAEKGQKLNAAVQNFKDQAIQIPETLLTGLCMGAMIGGIQNSLNNSFRVKSYNEAKKYGYQFAEDNNLPRPTNAYSYYNGEIKLYWNSYWNDTDFFHQRYPQLFPKNPNQYRNFVEITLHPNKPAIMKVYGYNRITYSGDFHNTVSLKELGFTGEFYPKHPADGMLTLAGPTTGNIVPFVDTRNRV